MFRDEEARSLTSCFNRARGFEMIFVLLARDAAAPAAIRAWVSKRIELGKNKADDPQILEALRCASIMEGQQLNGVLA